jgi:hypothetical protein
LYLSWFLCRFGVLVVQLVLACRRVTDRSYLQCWSSSDGNDHSNGYRRIAKHAFCVLCCPVGSAQHSSQFSFAFPVFCMALLSCAHFVHQCVFMLNRRAVLCSDVDNIAASSLVYSHFWPTEPSRLYICWIYLLHRCCTSLLRVSDCFKISHFNPI